MCACYHLYVLMERTVDSWRALLSGWLAVANFQLCHWWLEEAMDAAWCWCIGASVRIPFGEGDEAMLRWVKAKHPDVERFLSQERFF